MYRIKVLFRDKCPVIDFRAHYANDVLTNARAIMAELGGIDFEVIPA